MATGNGAATTGLQHDQGDGNGHFVQFYDHAPFLLDAASRYIGDALTAGAAGVVIATPEHREGLAEALAARGLDLAAAAEQGRYVVLDAAEALAAILVDGQPDAERFAAVVGDAVARAAASVRDGAGVHVFGEMVALLCADGQPNAAIRVEELWNALADTTRFSLFCAYPMSVFHQLAHDAAFEKICTQHAHVIPTESYTTLEPDARLRAVSQLQQKAQALETVQLELTQRLQQLAEGDRRKDELLAMLAHELRNPLSAVRNAVVTARLDASRRDRALDIARRQTDQLARLIDDLLDLARITQGRMALRKERLSVTDAIDRAVDATRALLEAREHTLGIALPADPVYLEADPGRLEQALANLLSNAAKYTERGGRIEMVAEREGESVVLRVRDSGIGIPADMLPHVFDLFTQGHRALDRAQGGLGIGLTVVRRIVELHGGKVEARSGGPGQGAEFVLRLPALPPEERSAHSPLSRPAAGTRSRVLIVEDNVDAAESLSMLLELLGHEVRVVHSGPEAMDVVRGETFDIALVDIGLPGMDGYEVARELRALLNGRGMTLVAVTGYGRDEDKQEAHSAGFDHHLTKPIDLDALAVLVGAVGTATTLQ